MNIIYDLTNETDINTFLNLPFLKLKQALDNKNHTNLSSILNFDIFTYPIISDPDKFELLLNNGLDISKIDRPVNLRNTVYSQVKTKKHIDLLIEHNFCFNHYPRPYNAYTLIREKEIVQYFHENVHYDRKDEDILHSLYNISKINKFGLCSYLLDDPIAREIILTDKKSHLSGGKFSSIKDYPLLFLAFLEANFPLIQLLYDKGVNFHQEYEGENVLDFLQSQKVKSEKRNKDFIKLSDTEKEKYLNTLSRLEAKKIILSVEQQKNKLSRINLIMQKGTCIDDFIGICVENQKERLKNQAPINVSISLTQNRL